MSSGLIGINVGGVFGNLNLNREPFFRRAREILRRRMGAFPGGGDNSPGDSISPGTPWVDEECVLCLRPLELTSPPLRLPCRHAVHIECAPNGSSDGNGTLACPRCVITHATDLPNVVTAGSAEMVEAE